MKDKASYVILGGAGYLGRHLVEYLKFHANVFEIFVISRNLDKKIFFSQHNNVHLVSCLSDVQTEHRVVFINAAFSAAPSHRQAVRETEKLFKEITRFFDRTNIVNAIHISTIILSLSDAEATKNGRNQPICSRSVVKANPYLAGKSVSEILFKRLLENRKINGSIVRSGNIIGPGAPWISKLIARGLAGLPVLPASNEGYSNGTFIWNLCHIVALAGERPSNVDPSLVIMNCAEMGAVKWSKIAQSVQGAMGINFLEWPVDPPKISVASDLKAIAKSLIATVIMGMVKRPSLGVIVEKIVGYFNREQLVGGAKGVITAVGHNWDISEFRAYQVFAERKMLGLEGVPEYFVNSLPYSADDALMSLDRWMADSRLTDLR